MATDATATIEVRRVTVLTWSRSGGASEHRWTSDQSLEQATREESYYRIEWTGIMYRLYLAKRAVFPGEFLGSEQSLPDVQAIAQKHIAGPPADARYKWSTALMSWRRIGNLPSPVPLPAAGNVQAIERQLEGGRISGWLIRNSRGDTLAIVPANNGEQTHREAGELARKIATAFNEGRL